MSELLQGQAELRGEWELCWEHHIFATGLNKPNPRGRKIGTEQRKGVRDEEGQTCSARRWRSMRVNSAAVLCAAFISSIGMSVMNSLFSQVCLQPSFMCGPLFSQGLAHLFFYPISDIVFTLHFIFVNSHHLPLTIVPSIVNDLNLFFKTVFKLLVFLSLSGVSLFIPSLLTGFIPKMLC